MDVHDFREILHEALVLYMVDGFSLLKEVKTFKEEGMISVNEGLVVRTQDDSEFQIIVTENNK